MSPKKALMGSKKQNRDLQVIPDKKPSARKNSIVPTDRFDVHSGKIFNSILMNEAATVADNSFNL